MAFAFGDLQSCRPRRAEHHRGEPCDAVRIGLGARTGRGERRKGSHDFAASPHADESSTRSKAAASSGSARC